MAYGFAQGDTSYTSGWTCQSLVDSPSNTNLGYDLKDPHGFHVQDHPNGGNLGTRPDPLMVTHKSITVSELAPPASQLQRENASLVQDTHKGEKSTPAESHGIPRKDPGILAAGGFAEANPEGTQPSEPGTFPGVVEAPAEGVVHADSVQPVQQGEVKDESRAWNAKPDGHEDHPEDAPNPAMMEKSPDNGKG